jgi:glycerophosphoryl diester phosphodiesterase
VPNPESRYAKSLAVASGPAVIAHGGGNSRDSAVEAVRWGADLIEADIWSYRGQLEMRHERRVPFTPILFERWYLKWGLDSQHSLSGLVQDVQSSAGILLDFKNRGDLPRLLREALTAAGGEPRVCASSQHWPVIRMIHEQVPSMEMFYSIDVEAQLELFFTIAERDALPTGVSCNHEHLDRGLIDRFHKKGLAVIAWTVDEPERAADLASWGVDAITTNDVQAVRSRLDRR